MSSDSNSKHSVKLEALNEVIANRRSIFPRNYIDQEIPEALIEMMLKNALRAPTHKFTEPWRFKIMRKTSMNRLANFLVEAYKKSVKPEAGSERKIEGIRFKLQKASAVIAIHLQRDPEQRIPEWEEIAAVAMAVQNIYLSCEAMHIGCYWSSPKMITQMHDFYEMAEGERCLGFIYLGYYEKQISPTKRKPIDEVVEWLD